MNKQMKGKGTHWYTDMSRRVVLAPTGQAKREVQEAL